MLKNRRSNFELMRILLTLMVIALHYFNQIMGGALNTTIGSNNYYICCFLESLSVIAVNGFVLTTGYFMIDKKNVALHKITNLICICIFYGFSLYILSILLKIQPFTFTSMKYSVLFFYDSKWFIGVYTILYLLIPYLNLIFEKSNRKNCKQLIIILFCFSSIIPTFFPKVIFNDKGYGIFSFIFLYFIGGYLKKYYEPNKPKIFYLSIYIICSVLTSILVLKNGLNNNRFWHYNSIINIISTLNLFLFFSKLNINSKVINYLSASTFSIYIIHSDPSIRFFLYRQIFKTEKYWNNHYMIFNFLQTIIGIYLICTLCDFLRKILCKLFFINKIKLFNNIEISSEIY